MEAVLRAPFLLIGNRLVYFSRPIPVPPPANLRGRNQTFRHGSGGSRARDSKPLRNRAKRQEWIEALNKIAALDAETMVAGHKRPGLNDSPRVLGESIANLEDFD